MLTTIIDWLIYNIGIKGLILAGMCALAMLVLFVLMIAGVFDNPNQGDL